MRTKTLALSALLGLIGAASAVAQTNVYSLNAVGYVNVTIPANSYSIITCPLFAGVDSVTGGTNTVNMLMNNGAGAPGGAGSLNGCFAYFFTPSGGYVTDQAEAIGTGKGKTSHTNGWTLNGVEQLVPGVACWFQTAASPVTFTFVGQVPQGSLTNTLYPGYNLVASAVPVSGDLQSNTVTHLINYNIGDAVYMYDPVATYTYNPGTSIGGIYEAVPSTGKGKGKGYNFNWSPGDALTYNVTQGFWYFNSSLSTPIQWVENFSINP
jgi:hypothetical protein